MNCGPIARGSRGCSLGSRRWTNAQDGTTHWRSITRENVTTLYRIDPTSRISDPTEARRVFSYLISRSFDDQGNVLLYDDLADDGAGVDAQAQVNEGNRPPLVRQTQRNLKRVRYGNATPHYPDWSPDPTASRLISMARARRCPHRFRRWMGYRRNLSPTNQVVLADKSRVTRAHFGPLEQVALLPADNRLDRVRLMDLGGGGRLAVATFDSRLPGFYERDAQGSCLAC